MRVAMGDLVQASSPLPGALQAFGMGWLGIVPVTGIANNDWTSSMGVSNSDPNVAPFSPFVPYGPAATPTEIANAAKITAANNAQAAADAQAALLGGGYASPADVYNEQNPGGGLPNPLGGMSTNTMLLVIAAAAFVGLAIMKR